MIKSWSRFHYLAAFFLCFSAVYLSFLSLRWISSRICLFVSACSHSWVFMKSRSPLWVELLGSNGVPSDILSSVSFHYGTGSSMRQQVSLSITKCDSHEPEPVINTFSLFLLDFFPDWLASGWSLIFIVKSSLLGALVFISYFLLLLLFMPIKPNVFLNTAPPTLSSKLGLNYISATKPFWVSTILAFL